MKIKGDKFYFAFGLLYFLVGVYLMFASILQIKMFPKVLFMESGICLLLSGIGLFYVYYKGVNSK